MELVLMGEEYVINGLSEEDYVEKYGDDSTAICSGSNKLIEYNKDCNWNSTPKLLSQTLWHEAGHGLMAECGVRNIGLTLAQEEIIVEAYAKQLTRMGYLLS